MTKQTNSAEAVFLALLAELEMDLPEPKPVAAYVAAKRAGSLLFVSGQLTMERGDLIATGTVPGAVDEAKAKACAVRCAVNGLAVAKAALGSLDRVRSVASLGVFVASEPGFVGQPRIADAASEVMVRVFGEAGRHARAAVGSVALPLGAPVEIEMTLEVVEAG
ncbi:MAG: RidA family protein [Planctomycetota bacterium]